MRENIKQLSRQMLIKGLSSRTNVRRPQLNKV